MEGGLDARMFDGYPVSNFKTEILDHADGIGRRLPRGCQVPFDKDRVAGVEGEGLKAPKIDLASPGHANLGLWKDEAE